MLLIVAAALALVAANSPASPWYGLLLDVPVEVRIGALQIAKPLVLWVNDGLMAIFFFLVGLELKREVLDGELSDSSSVVLPLVAAIGGIVVPVSIFVALNYTDPDAMSGWAVPAATDIAFALGILALFGSRVPIALKVFLMSIAIFDDVAAIVIIAVFYSQDLSMTALIVAIVCMVVLFVMNKRGISSVSPYVWIGVVMWIALLKSGVHATLAGIALAAFIPMQAKDEPDRSPLRELENDLHHLVAFIVLPLFAFMNAGVPFAGMGLNDFLHPVSVGVAGGLFVGKQVGIFLCSWLTIRLGFARMPEGANYGSVYGVAALCGIGFTMSMFIGSLAFEHDPTDLDNYFDERVGIIIGSVLSALVAMVVLHLSLPRAEKPGLESMVTEGPH